MLSLFLLTALACFCSHFCLSSALNQTVHLCHQSDGLKSKYTYPTIPTCWWHHHLKSIWAQTISQISLSLSFVQSSVPSVCSVASWYLLDGLLLPLADARLCPLSTTIRILTIVCMASFCSKIAIYLIFSPIKGELLMPLSISSETAKSMISSAVTPACFWIPYS